VVVPTVHLYQINKQTEIIVNKIISKIMKENKNYILLQTSSSKKNLFSKKKERKMDRWSIWSGCLLLA